MTGVAVVGPPAVLAQAPVRWAIGRLDGAATTHGAHVVLADDRDCALTVALIPAEDSMSIAAAGLRDVPHSPESYALRIVADETGGRRIAVAAPDDVGFTYALTEIGERLAAGGLGDFTPGPQQTQRPAVPVRGIQRIFASVGEDSAWLHDRAFWTDYLDHVATQRFNRFHLAFGMQYNYGTGVESRTASDNYLCFAYPFLLDVPGFHVRAQGVTAAERDRNLAALAHIAGETRRRGMSFQLGLWNHAYDYGYDSRHWYPILGISPEIHADYCAAAIRMLLAQIPEIDGLTFRVHYEGGIHDQGHEVFWEKVFHAVSEAGRPLQVDMHAKGIDQAILDAVDKPGIRPVISGKYWAEHMGVPYHQASIRHRELEGATWPGFDAQVAGVTDVERRLTRYGYADFLSEDRPVDFMFRVWPGTQKLLLWGDPAMASGFGRFATFGGSRGVEFCEPLSFKGRKGTGEPGGRDPYLRDDLRLGVADWHKYRYTYLLWGRLLYDPDAPPETWRRFLRTEYGAAAADMESALASLSRILPLVSVVHGVSGANNFYWPEMYVDLPISFWRQSSHYAFDTPAPSTWEGVSPFDPTMFYAVGEYADDALDGALTGKYTPLEVASWIEQWVADGEAAISRVRAGLDEPPAAQVHRTLIDLDVLTRLGRFFAGKFRAAVHYAVFRRTADPTAISETIRLLEAAHASYAAIADVLAGVYQEDLAFGVGISERGHWADRLPAMREDLFALSLERDEALRVQPPPIAKTPVARDDRWRLDDARFVVPERFTRGQPLEVRLETGTITPVDGAELHYRHVDQSETFHQVVMDRQGTCFSAWIPGEFTASSYPLMFFAEVRRAGDQPIFVPGLNDTLSNQPYVVLHSTEWPVTR
ncbi:hypothetical protein [Phytoactinopolyspora endophytica]|uniref:hypothetical protein n=1 Tax=Phytoactinopolyspora endophytica TaxID=1642495 RepID=UPI00101D4248|nr:hypothetical protein [Phytoactinopolyspora endophytica]